MRGLRLGLGKGNIFQIHISLYKKVHFPFQYEHQMHTHSMWPRRCSNSCWEPQTHSALVENYQDAFAISNYKWRESHNEGKHGNVTHGL